MKVLVVSALVLCVAVQVLAELTSEEAERIEVEQLEVQRECSRFGSQGLEFDFECYYRKLQVTKEVIDENKLKELILATRGDLDDEKAQMLVDNCVHERGQRLFECYTFAQV